NQGLGILDAAKVADTDKPSAAQFYFNFSQMLLNGSNGPQAWKLQTLSDLTTLPDYEEGYGYYGWRGGRGGWGGSGRGAPVDEKGNPVFHQVPKNWAAAASDGERWRWCLLQASELGMAHQVRLNFAQFLQNQFDVQTMAYGGYGGSVGRGGEGGGDKNGKKDEAGPFAVSTLGEDETIARLANGVKRFKLPDEFNFIKLYGIIAADNTPNNNDYARQALESLGQIFENRQQYPRAAGCWKECIARFGPGNSNYRQKRLDQIVGNWGRFETVPTQTSEAAPLVGFRFRNAKKVTFTATRVDLPTLLADVKAYLKTNPINQDRNHWWEKSSIDNIGYRIVEQNQKKYLLDEAAKWDLALEPRENHRDLALTLTLPDALKKPGCYLLKADIDGGNTTFIVMWVADTIIVKKPLNDATLYFVADAASGAPVANATVDCFGWQQRYLKDNNYTIDTAEFAEKTDADGQLILTPKQAAPNLQWLVTVTTDAKEGAAGRFAWYGYSGVWYPRYENDYDYQYKQAKAFFISDRPVYRPDQTVKWKFWLNKAQYDQEGKSPFAGQSILVQINDPRGQKLMEMTFVADDFGGFNGELALPHDAMLGVYSISLPKVPDLQGGGSFRVEEYKKPEFEVSVDAPTDPVMLGDKITATIKAKYYFGAPVVNAKVKYKVTRTSYSGDWYPIGRWDWLFEPGYWWFACDYQWYPG
ncbi:MAG: MG2 domain-containing protein, partial [Phycisphaerae bacterium]